MFEKKMSSGVFLLFLISAHITAGFVPVIQNLLSKSCTISARISFLRLSPNKNFESSKKSLKYLKLGDSDFTQQEMDSISDEKKIRVDPANPEVAVLEALLLARDSKRIAKYLGRAGLKTRDGMTGDVRIVSFANGTLTLRLSGTFQHDRQLVLDEVAAFIRSALTADIVKDVVLEGAPTPDHQAAHLRRCATTLRGHFGWAYCVSWRGDGSILASGDYEGDLLIWTRTDRGWSWKDFIVIRAHIGPLKAVAFSPNGKLLATASWDELVKVWGGPGYAKCVATLRGGKNWAHCVAWGPDGGVLAAGWRSGSVIVYGGEDWKTIATLKGHTGRVHTLAISGDGQYLASGSYDRTARIWGGKDFKECLAILEGHTGEVRSLSWSKDSSLLATGSTDETIRLWRDKGGERGWTCVGMFTGHHDWVMGVAFSPCGGFLASASADGKIRVWGGQDFRKRLVALEGHKEAVTGLAWSPDGRYLASVSEDKMVKVWKE